MTIRATAIYTPPQRLLALKGSGAGTGSKTRQKPQRAKIHFGIERTSSYSQGAPCPEKTLNLKTDDLFPLIRTISQEAGQQDLAEFWENTNKAEYLDELCPYHNRIRRSPLVHADILEGRVSVYVPFDLILSHLNSNRGKISDQDITAAIETIAKEIYGKPQKFNGVPILNMSNSNFPEINGEKTVKDRRVSVVSWSAKMIKNQFDQVIADVKAISERWDFVDHFYEYEPDDPRLSFYTKINPSLEKSTLSFYYYHKGNGGYNGTTFHKPDNQTLAITSRSDFSTLHDPEGVTVTLIFDPHGVRSTWRTLRKDETIANIPYLIETENPLKGIVLSTAKPDKDIAGAESLPFSLIVSKEAEEAIGQIVENRMSFLRLWSGTNV